MKTTQPELVDAVRAADASAAPITGEAKDLLVAELTADPEGRGYEAPLASSDWARVLELLHGSYSVTITAERVAKVVSGRSLKLWLGDLMDRLELSDAPAELKNEWRMRAAARIPMIVDDAPASADALQAWGGALLEARLTTEEEILAVSTEILPQRVAMALPRAEVVLGAGVVVEASDLIALRVEGLI